MSPHPTPIALAPLGSVAASHYACSVCKHVTGWADPGGYAFHAAEKCCSTVCDTCGETKEIRGYCAPCSAAREAATEAQNFEKALKVPAAEHRGPVYSHGSDRFWPDIDEALEWYAEEEIEPPAYLWGCSITDQIVDSALDECSENCEAEAMNELRAFIETWNAKQTQENWFEDNRLAVLL